MIHPLSFSFMRIAWAIAAVVSRKTSTMVGTASLWATQTNKVDAEGRAASYEISRRVLT